MPNYIGRYRAERVVGSGAFATVWLAHDETLDAPVAIKVLAENWAHDDEVKRRFLEEARILWRADSGHIVRIHNVDELPDGRPYFVMDYADRGTLQQRMAARGEGAGWPFDEAVAIGLAIADGLKVAHALGIVHRDLKPANIMFQSVPAHHGDERDEKLILTDFGMAKSLARSRGTTIATGTPHYMAPEQIEGRADERSDIYAAAAVLYELIAGRVPYPSDTPGQLFAAHSAGPPPPLSDLRPDTPPAHAAAIDRGMARDPSERWPTVETWAAALAAARAPSGSERIPAALAGDLQRTMAPAEIAAAREREAAAVNQPSLTPPASAGDRPRRRRRLGIILPIAGVLAAVVAAAVVIVATGAKDADAGTPLLMPAASVGLDPFTPSVVPKTPVDSPVTPNPNLPKPLAGQSLSGLVGRLLSGLNAIPQAPPKLKFPRLKLPTAPKGKLPAVRGSAYGLYGGTQLLSVCDSKRLIRFLVANPDKAKAWAAVQGISTSEIPAYISRLTDVVLQADTRVTNHGFRNGAANPIDEILQRGTAVLVDAFGVPRARCYCGNPLTPPPTTTVKKVTGTPWPGFDLAKTVTVAPAPKPLRVLPTSDVLTGTTFVLRRIGFPPRAASIVDRTGTLPATIPPPTTTTTTTPTTPTAPTTTTETPPATTTAPTTTAPPATTTVSQVTDITGAGSTAASSIFSSQYPVANATDGDVTTSWFSIGDKEGPNSTFTWTSSGGPVSIGTIQLVSNAQNSTPSIRTGFGFSSVKIQVLADGRVVWTGTGQRPGDDDVTVQPGVEGDTIRLTLIDHENPTCGGFAELRVLGRS